jgi:hypothetical protein
MKDMCDPKTKVLFMAATQRKTELKGNYAKKRISMSNSLNAYYVTLTQKKLQLISFLNVALVRFSGGLLDSNGTDFALNNMIIEAKQRYFREFLMEIIITGCWSFPGTEK